MLKSYDLIRRSVCTDKLYTLSCISALFCKGPGASNKIQKCHMRPRAVTSTCPVITTVPRQASQPARPHSSSCNLTLPIPVAVNSKMWVCGRSLSGIPCSNPVEGHGCLSVVSIVCCYVKVSATGRSLVQRSPTECISVTDRGQAQH